MVKIIKIGIVLVPILIMLFFDLLFGVVAVLVLAGLALGAKKIEKRDSALAILLFLIFAMSYYVYFLPAISIANGQGTVLDDNWFQALNWVKNNTPECTVVATYWDPGHFITGIAERAVVFDGASQADLFTRPYNYSTPGLVVENYDDNIHHIVLYSDGNKSTARIQDISTSLLTSNETIAIEMLKDYRKPGCDSMYYIASADLIGKSTWWSYFATWDPVTKHGTPYVYMDIPLGTAKPDISQNAIIYTYPFSAQQAFVVYQTNSSIVVFLQQQGTAEPLKVSRFVYFTQDGTGRIFTQSDYKVDGLVWISPGGQEIIFIPPQLENAMFTKMFLFNGQGLQHFEFINSWGGEVKLFKVKFQD